MIDDLRKELKSKDDAFVADLKRQDEDVTVLLEKMSAQVSEETKKETQF